MRITLTMDEETARTLATAAEVFTRILCGQYEIISDYVMGARQEYLGVPEDQEERQRQFHDLIVQKRRALVLLMQAKHEQFPELTPRIGDHWGLGYNRRGDIAFNIYQAIHYGLAWHREPNGGDAIHFSPPTMDRLPFPAVEIDGKVYLKGNMAADYADGQQENHLPQCNEYE